MRLLLIGLILFTGCASKQSFQLKSKVGIKSNLYTMYLATLKISYESRK